MRIIPIAMAKFNGTLREMQANATFEYRAFAERILQKNNLQCLRFLVHIRYCSNESAFAYCSTWKAIEPSSSSCGF
jgi:hypothetical protein